MNEEWIFKWNSVENRESDMSVNLGVPLRNALTLLFSTKSLDQISTKSAKSIEDWFLTDMLNNEVGLNFSTMTLIFHKESWPNLT